MVRHMLSLGARPAKNACDESVHCPAVHRASYIPEHLSYPSNTRPDQSFEILEALVAHGANVNIVGGLTAGTALHAAVCGRPDSKDVSMDDVSRIGVEKIKLLLSAGADVKATGRDGAALAYATEAGRLPELKILVDHGADINSTHKRWTSALGAALMYNHIEIAEFLVKLYNDRLSMYSPT